MALKLSAELTDLLCALALGAVLKAHRDVDGHKRYQLHPLQGAATVLPQRIVDPLKHHKLIASNKKFPAATYILTDLGRQTVEHIVGAPVNSLSARKFDA